MADHAISIEQAVIKARDAALRAGVPDSQAGMVACLAVKAEMADTVDNLIALRDVMVKVRQGRLGS